MGTTELPFSQYLGGLIGLGIIIPVFLFILVFFFVIYIKCIKPMRAQTFSEMIKNNVVVRLDNGIVARVHDGKEIRNGAFLINKHEIVRLVDGRIVKMHDRNEITSEGVLTGFLIGSAPLGLDPISNFSAYTGLVAAGSSAGAVGNFGHDTGALIGGSGSELGICGGGGDMNCDFSADFGGDCGADCSSFAFGGD